jgi:hypothetical protein
MRMEPGHDAGQLGGAVLDQRDQPGDGDAVAREKPVGEARRLFLHRPILSSSRIPSNARGRKRARDRHRSPALDRRAPLRNMPSSMGYALARNGLVLTGLLLLVVGLGNVIAGRSKVTQYLHLVDATASHAPADPAALFPAASERDERHALAQAKVAFYQLLVTTGQLLGALGAALVAVGALVVSMRIPRAPTDAGAR